MTSRSGSASIGVVMGSNSDWDVMQHACTILKEFGVSFEAKVLSASAAQLLVRHAWPGNVRELRNLMERCNALVRQRVIGAADLSGDLAMTSGERVEGNFEGDWLGGELPATVERLERLMIGHALAQAQGNRAEAARRLGIHRQLLYRKMAQYGLE